MYHIIMNIGFFVRQFSERGTEVAIYDYAQFNEEILHNKSYIICFTENKQKLIGFSNERFSYMKFKLRFPILEINDISDMTSIINKYNIHFFHTLTHGNYIDIYKFNDKNIWGNCKTIKHCVFDTIYNDSNFHICISNTAMQIKFVSLTICADQISFTSVRKPKLFTLCKSNL